MRDGRLAGAERASFERHVTVCPACLHEVQALEALAESLRVRSPDRTAADELHVRRERTRLLAAFDRALVAPERPRKFRHRLIWPAPVAALVVAVLLVLPSVRRPAEPRARASRAVVQADSTSVWAERTEGDRENVVLERGALWIHVDHSSGEGRLLVVLPDGELEDIGTTFTVSADDGHTTRVAVQDGHVVLRLRDQAAIALGPGDTWIPDPRPVASASASVAPPSADPVLAARLDRGEQRTPVPRPSAALAPPSGVRCVGRFPGRDGCARRRGQSPSRRGVRELPRQASSRRTGGRRRLPARHCVPEVRGQRGHEASGPGVPPSLPGGVPPCRGGTPVSMTRARLSAPDRPPRASDRAAATVVHLVVCGRCRFAYRPPEWVGLDLVDRYRGRLARVVRASSASTPRIS